MNELQYWSVVVEQESSDVAALGERKCRDYEALILGLFEVHTATQKVDGCWLEMDACSQIGFIGLLIL
jgi:hypothetical protein